MEVRLRKGRYYSAIAFSALAYKQWPANRHGHYFISFFHFKILYGGGPSAEVLVLKGPSN